jgi:phenylpropionate dioxygenase-like ring-hydroxylating dioxygenase large terminal subunit
VLSRHDNELITLVGEDRPMREVLRRCWMPAVRSNQLEPDGAPARVRLLGETYVAFRATDGRVGFIDEGCPHRGTSMALARNEDCALTCIFHGWKIDVSGVVVDVPSEPPARRKAFAAKVKVGHHPAREAGGIVWVYLGDGEAPQFPAFEFCDLPEAHVLAGAAVVNCNWLQNLEGFLDSSHVSILHSSTVEPATGSGHEWLFEDSSPVFELEMTEYGYRAAAIRQMHDESAYYLRVSEYVFPFFVFIPSAPTAFKQFNASIPIDDTHTLNWYVLYHVDRPMDPTVKETYYGGYHLRDFHGDYGFHNLWGQDRVLMRSGHFTGITDVVREDYSVQESMGPIVDRSREKLGSSDAAITRMRRMLLDAVDGAETDGAQAMPSTKIDYPSIRAFAVKVPKGTDWRRVPNR